ncbi:Vacuolar protein sorting-associated protein 54 [Penicillium hispanicum]|uniref:Vacuolar protein sorting-associated protein 54 n=1 Tax=Penicillium hispanicum TaxID=1080232 RepID=UPI00254062B9|nr:Vacuolar protein sorting-associated protein 54 [Penicillium hispanicum]KAJ5586716.1 Vacuolar protein sorting-associated protein 54 [Penicillium hispanicum]
MAPNSPRKSIDSLASGASVPSLSHYSTTQLESPRIPPQRYPLRRGSTASSIVSIGGILDTSQHHGSIAESGQNAISTLLQPPIVRTGLTPHTAVSTTGYKPPSSRDIPPVTLTNITHVDTKAFQPYLSQVGSLYDVFQQSKESSAEDSQNNQGPQPPPRPEDTESLMPWSPERRPSLISINSRPTSPYDSRGRRSSSFRGRGHLVTPLSTIPPLYFEEDFRLENPRTFDVISEKSEVVRPPRPPIKDDHHLNGTLEPVHTGRKALATNAILQEKLSWYMDTVEIHLISSISTASKSFFTALGSLRELHAEAADSVNRIQVLRRDLQKIDKEMALGGLKIVNLRRRRENVRILAAAVAQLRDIVGSVSRCEELVEQGDIEVASDELEEVEKLMAGEKLSDRSPEDKDLPQRAIDLRGLKALEGASEDLDQLRQRIGMGYETRFLNDLLGDLRQHVQTVSSGVSLQRWGSSFPRQRGGQRPSSIASPAYMDFDNELRSRLHIQLTGLARSRYTTPAVTSFKTAVLREMKGLIRKHLPSSSDDDNESMVSVSTHGDRQRSQQEKSSMLARNLRALDPEDAYTMLVAIYTGISECLRRLSVQVKVLLDIASGLGGPPASSVKSPPRSLDQTVRSSQSEQSASAMAQDEILQVLDMSSLLGQAVDIAQSQITKVLKVRSEQTTQLPKEEFLKYFTLNRLFADECEAISGRGGTALKTIVGNQIRDFITKFGDSQRYRIVKAMDADRWDARDFGDPEVTILTRILDASTKDIEAWVEVSKIWAQDGQNKQKSETSAPINGSGKDKVRSAVIDEQKYILPDSAMAIMRSIEEFEFLMSNIPSMIQDIAPQLLEILKLFNSRSSQLILGAGATRSAGLKNITTKHLALSSQALSFVIALVPYIREFVRRHGQSNQVMAEFDKVKRLCQEHQNGIHEKLVDIMSSRSTVHVNAMKKIEWDAEGASAAVHPYMETLAKETGTLHRVLSKHLPEMTVDMIMGPVFNSYRDQWVRAFDEASVQTEAGKKSMQADVEHFRAKLGKIDGAGLLGDKLLEIVQAKPIAAAGTEGEDLEPSSTKSDQDKASDHGES